jgi:hypothetical protein
MKEKDMETAVGKWLAVGAVAVLVGACGPTGGYQRGLFQGYVVGSTESEIESKIGKPDSVDNSDAKAPRWVYNKKTFDPDNANQSDARTIVVFRQGADGKFTGSDVIFSAN